MFENIVLISKNDLRTINIYYIKYCQNVARSQMSTVNAPLVVFYYWEIEKCFTEVLCRGAKTFSWNRHSYKLIMRKTTPITLFHSVIFNSKLYYHTHRKRHYTAFPQNLETFHKQQSGDYCNKESQYFLSDKY
jgi:hypothetical protein